MNEVTGSGDAGERSRRGEKSESCLPKSEGCRQKGGFLGMAKHRG
jgi:hypothetical protein